MSIVDEIIRDMELAGKRVNQTRKDTTVGRRRKAGDRKRLESRWGKDVKK